MNEVTFSGIATFSYVWNKNEERSALYRFFYALGAGIVGCTFGYKVNVSEVFIYLKEYKKTYFSKEFNRKIESRNVKKTVDKNIQDAQDSRNTLKKQKCEIKEKRVRTRYNTHPHEGKSYWMCNGKHEKYITSDAESVYGEKIVKIESNNRKKKSSVFIKYEHVKTDTNVDAYRALEYHLELTKDKYKVSKLYDEICEKASENYDVRQNSRNIPEFIFIQGSPEKQHKYVKDNANDYHVVVLNESQINYQEQLDEHHDILKESDVVYRSPAFGPVTVKTEKGGIEFLAHTLIESNKTEFSGAFYDIFKSRFYKNKLHAKGGYYTSDLNEDQWYSLAERLMISDKKTEGFRWKTVTKNQIKDQYKVDDEDDDETMKVDGKTIYQIGAINASNKDGYHSYLHKQCGPPLLFAFAIFFNQFRNALLRESNTEESIVVHTTALGEDALGNEENVSMVALLSAIMSLPLQNRCKINNVFFGSYKNTNAFNKFGDKISLTSVKKL